MKVYSLLYILLGALSQTCPCAKAWPTLETTAVIINLLNLKGSVQTSIMLIRLNLNLSPFFNAKTESVL